MKAYKCDRCGKFFEKNDNFNTDEDLIIQRAVDCVRGDDRYDLCPACLVELEVWFKKYGAEFKEVK